MWYNSQIRRHKLSEVEKVVVTFIKDPDRYVVNVEVYFYKKSKTAKLAWDEQSLLLVLFRVREPLDIND